MDLSYDESNNVVVIETSDSEFDDEDKDSWKPMQENEYKLHKLMKSAFAQPFYSRPSSTLGVQIFPSSWADQEVPKCLSDVRAWQFKHSNSTVEDLIERAMKILKSHIEYYRSGPEETHDEEYSSDELVCLAEHLQKKLNRLTVTETNDNLDPVNTVYEKLREMFPKKDPMFLLAKSNEHILKAGKMGGELVMTQVIDEVLRPSTRDNECKIFPFYPGRFHNFDEQNVFHFYTASSQFYKMALTKSPITEKPITNPFQAIQSIEYIENKMNTENYQHCKFTFREKSEEFAKEILLFHGTDVQNIDGIFNTNFNIDSSPVDRRKAMVFGRGIYMSEFPGVSLNYGNGLLLCKVVLGSIESISMDDVSARTQVIGQQFDSREVVKDGVTVMCVIKNSHQILPYCVINLQNVNSSHPAQNNFSFTQNNFPPAQNSFNSMAPAQNMFPATLTNVTTLQHIVPPPGHGFCHPAHGFPPPVYSHGIPAQGMIHPATGTWQMAQVFHPPLGGSLPTSSQNSQPMTGPISIPSMNSQPSVGSVPPPSLNSQPILSSQGRNNSGSQSSINNGTTSFSAISPGAVIPTSSQTTSNPGVSSHLLQLPSTCKANNIDSEEYKKKIKDLEKFVEPLKKKLKDTDPSLYKKLQKLLEIISNTKKKVQLSVLLHCEKVLKKCIPNV